MDLAGHIRASDHSREEAAEGCEHLSRPELGERPDVRVPDQRPFLEDEGVADVHAHGVLVELKEPWEDHEHDLRRRLRRRHHEIAGEQKREQQGHNNNTNTHGTMLPPQRDQPESPRKATPVRPLSHKGAHLRPRYSESRSAWCSGQSVWAWDRAGIG